MTKQGPGAAAFLLLAEGHLRKAKEILDQEPLHRAIYNARHDTMRATNLVKHARTILDKQKEEPCKKS